MSAFFAINIWLKYHVYHNLAHICFADKFLPFKTPLDARYSDQIPEESRFDLDMLFASLKSFKV